jgi:hypothetical protein
MNQVQDESSSRSVLRMIAQTRSSFFTSAKAGERETAGDHARIKAAA